MVCHVNQFMILQGRCQVLLIIVTWLYQTHIKVTQHNYLYPLWCRFWCLLHTMHGWTVIRGHVCPYNVPFSIPQLQQETHHVRAKVEPTLNLPPRRLPLDHCDSSPMSTLCLRHSYGIARSIQVMYSLLHICLLEHPPVHVPMLHSPKCCLHPSIPP